jgi:site-specific DNA-methyltransferase (adenine-specific)
LYRLYCMGCIEGAKKYIADNSIDLIVTDPPYGISGNHLDKHYHRNEGYVIDGYVEIPLEQYAEFSIRWMKQAERILRPGGSAYIFSGYSNLYHILNALQQTRLKEVNHIIWKYNFGVYTSKKYVSSHYHILYCVKPGGKIIFNTYSRYGSDERDISGNVLNYKDREDVWIINRTYKPGKQKNKNELPDELLIKIMQYSSNEGDHIVDFFLGGFSTAKVAIGLNRSITGFELNKNSFDHHIAKIKTVNPGDLLSMIRRGNKKHPVNQHKPWNEEQRIKLNKRYIELYNKIKNKKRVIEILQQEFGRGYFSIVNQININLQAGR